MRRALIVTGLLLAAGCKHSTPQADHTSPPPVVVTTAPTHTHAPPAKAAPVDPCKAFATFMADLTTYTPHDVARLIPDAQRVQAAAMHSKRRIFDDANNLVAFVASSGFPDHGNILSAPIQRMSDDCP